MKNMKSITSVEGGGPKSKMTLDELRFFVTSTEDLPGATLVRAKITLSGNLRGVTVVTGDETP